MKKPMIQEILSKIEYDPSTKPEDYSFILRDKNHYIEVSYMELKNMAQEHAIPTHRITLVRKGETTIFVRPDYCSICGKPLAENHTTT